jgi:hypothetical protein
MTPTAADGFVAPAIEPQRALVLGDPMASATWALMLEPIDDKTSRLVTRVSARFDRFISVCYSRCSGGRSTSGCRRQLLNLRRRVQLVPGQSWPNQPRHLGIELGRLVDEWLVA